MANIHITSDGDSFDTLALHYYNDEKMASSIVQANPDYCDVLIFDAGVSQVTVFDQYVYLLTEQGISRIQPSNLAYQTIDCNTGGKKILICKSDEVILCGGQSAIYYKFEN